MRVEVGAIAPRPPFWVMYTSKPPTPALALTTSPRHATLRQTWWTIPESDRLQMHAFTHPSHQLRQMVRAGILRSIHHTSLYRRLILQARKQGAHIAATGKALHTRLRDKTKEGTNLLKIYMVSYIMANWPTNTAMHQRMDECPLCHLPDSCTHIAGKCKAHKHLHISRYNAACQLVHAAIRNSAKCGGALYRAKDLALATTNVGNQPQT
jgi:hypothetical protein